MSRQSVAITENYAHFDENPVKEVTSDPVSTFSVDVDTGSYANVRRFLNSGEMPPSDSVRIEEMINYFPYDYLRPDNPETPFAVNTEVGPTPWNPHTKLLRIGLKGIEVPHENRPPANLVFLADVSGSMDSPDKLPLLVASLKMLTGELGTDDRVTLVVYAGAAGVVLETTPGDRKAEIRAALEQLQAGGSTAGGQGIALAYAMAEKALIDGGINRVILATDGDFNVGTVGIDALKDLVERKRKTGISLTVLGFGTGNLNDALAEGLADVGNGNYAYIDNLSEAKKVLVNELGSTLHTIAKDVKIQIEFNPAVIAEYRLIGYENRLLAREDFKNDKVDAGDIGAGHVVTALYEIALVGSPGVKVDPLRYQQRVTKQPAASVDEFAFLKLRYKLPSENESRLTEIPLASEMLRNKVSGRSPDFNFASAVAAFGQLLRGGTYMDSFSYHSIIRLAEAGRGADRHGYRAEFIELVGLAMAMDFSRSAPPVTDIASEGPTR